MDIVTVRARPEHWRGAATPSPPSVPCSEQLAGSMAVGLVGSGWARRQPPYHDRSAPCAASPAIPALQDLRRLLPPRVRPRGIRENAGLLCPPHTRPVSLAASDATRYSVH